MTRSLIVPNPSPRRLIDRKFKPKDRVVYARQRHAYTTYYDAKVLAVAPSGRRVKIEYDHERYGAEPLRRTIYVDVSNLRPAVWRPGEIVRLRGTRYLYADHFRLNARKPRKGWSFMGETRGVVVAFRPRPRRQESVLVCLDPVSTPRRKVWVDPWSLAVLVRETAEEAKGRKSVEALLRESRRTEAANGFTTDS